MSDYDAYGVADMGAEGYGDEYQQLNDPNPYSQRQYMAPGFQRAPVPYLDAGLDLLVPDASADEGGGPMPANVMAPEGYDAQGTGAMLQQPFLGSTGPEVDEFARPPSSVSAAEREKVHQLYLQRRHMKPQGSFWAPADTGPPPAMMVKPPPNVPIYEGAPPMGGDGGPSILGRAVGKFQDALIARRGAQQPGGGAMGGGGMMGGLAPIQEPYSPYQSEAEVHVDFAHRRDELIAQLKASGRPGKTFMVGDKEHRDYRNEPEFKALAEEEEAAAEHWRDFADSLDFDVLQAERYRLASQQRQEELAGEAQGHEGRAHDMNVLATQRAQQELEATYRKAEARRGRIDAQIAGEMHDFKKAIVALEGRKIDPGRVWKEKGTWGQIGFFLTALLSGAAPALMAAAGPKAGVVSSMGGAQGASPIDRLVDQDIAAQVQEMDNAKTGLAARQNLVGMMREQLGDVDRATAASKAYIYEKLENRARIYESTAKSAIIRTNAKALRERFGQQRQQFEMDAQNLARARAEEAERRRAIMLAGAAAHPPVQEGLTPEEQAQLEAGNLALWDKKDLDDQGFTYLNGIGVVQALKPEDKKEVLDAVAASKEQIRLINELRQMAKSKVGWENYQRKEQLLGALIRSYKQGNTKMFDSDKEADQLRDTIGDPNKPWTEADAKLSQLEVQTTRARDDKLNAYGRYDAVDVPMRDQKGRVRVKYKVRFPRGPGQPGSAEFNYQPVIGGDTPYTPDPNAAAPEPSDVDQGMVQARKSYRR